MNFNNLPFDQQDQISESESEQFINNVYKYRELNHMLTHSNQPLQNYQVCSILHPKEKQSYIDLILEKQKLNNNIQLKVNLNIICGNNDYYSFNPPQTSLEKFPKSPIIFLYLDYYDYCHQFLQKINKSKGYQSIKDIKIQIFNIKQDLKDLKKLNLYQKFPHIRSLTIVLKDNINLQEYSEFSSDLEQFSKQFSHNQVQITLRFYSEEIISVSYQYEKLDENKEDIQAAYFLIRNLQLQDEIQQQNIKTILQIFEKQSTYLSIDFSEKNIQYEQNQLDYLFKSFKKFKKIKSISLNLQECTFLTSNFQQDLENLLKKYQNLLQFKLNLENQPYLPKNFLQNLLNSLKKIQTLRQIDLIESHNRIQILKNHNEQGDLLNFDFQNPSLDQLTEDRNQLQYIDTQLYYWNPNKQRRNNLLTDHKEIIESHKKDLEFLPYENYGITVNQLQILSNLLENNENYSFSALNFNFLSKNLFDQRPQILIFLDNLLSHLQIRQQITNQINQFSLKFDIDNFQQQQIIQKLQEIIELILEKCEIQTHFQIEIHNKHYILSIQGSYPQQQNFNQNQNSQHLFIKSKLILKSESQMKLPYINQTLNLILPFTNQLSIKSASTIEITDLQMYSIIQVLQNYPDFSNLENFKLNIENSQKLSEETFSDLQKFIRKPSLNLKKYQVKLKKNKTELQRSSFKSIAKCFSNLENLLTLKIQFQQLKYANYENLNQILLNLAQNTQNLQKINLIYTKEGDISTVNQGLKNLLSNNENLRHIKLIFPKMLQEKQSQRDFFTKYLDFSKIQKLLIIIKYTAIIHKKIMSKIENSEKKQKNIISVNPNLTAGLQNQIVNFIGGYLQTQKFNLKNLKIKTYHFRYQQQNFQNVPLIENYQDYIGNTDQLYYYSPSFQLEIFNKRISQHLKSIQNLQKFQFKYSPNQGYIGYQPYSIPDLIQNTLINSNLSQVKIQSPFYKLNIDLDNKISQAKINYIFEMRQNVYHFQQNLYNTHISKYLANIEENFKSFSSILKRKKIQIKLIFNQYSDQQLLQILKIFRFYAKNLLFSEIKIDIPRPIKIDSLQEIIYLNQDHLKTKKQNYLVKLPALNTLQNSELPLYESLVGKLVTLNTMKRQYADAHQEFMNFLQIIKKNNLHSSLTPNQKAEMFFNFFKI